MTEDFAWGVYNFINEWKAGNHGEICLQEALDRDFSESDYVLRRETTCMKSIYEASVAYGREHQGTVNIEDFEAGANYVLEQIERELQRRMLEDYNQGAEEDEVAQGCMATMIMYVRQLKK